MITVGDLLAQVSDPARPLLTWYDDATGERTELSAATLGNWTAKTANLLVDGLGLGPGDRAVLALPPHWQTAAILLGCAAAGLRVTVGSSAGHTGDVGFATLDRLNEIDAGDVFAVSLHPLALPVRDLPTGVGDWALEARQHGDHFSAYQPLDPAPETWRPSRGDRVLIDTDTHPDPAVWLWAPLIAGASIVACAHTSVSTMARRAEMERVSVLMTADRGDGE